MITEFFKLPKQVQAGIGTTAAGLIGFAASAVHFIKSKGAICSEMMRKRSINHVLYILI